MERLDPSWCVQLKGKQECGRLGRKVFRFLGGATLHYIENGKSKYTECRVVPGNSFEVYLQHGLLPPTSPKEEMLAVVKVPSTPLTAAFHEPSLPTTSPLTAFAGSFDGLPEVIEENTNEYDLPS